MAQICERLPLTLQWIEHLCNTSSTDDAFSLVQLPKPPFLTKTVKLPNTSHGTLSVR